MISIYHSIIFFYFRFFIMHQLWGKCQMCVIALFCIWSMSASSTNNNTVQTTPANENCQTFTATFNQSDCENFCNQNGTVHKCGVSCLHKVLGCISCVLFVSVIFNILFYIKWRRALRVTSIPKTTDKTTGVVTLSVKHKNSYDVLNKNTMANHNNSSLYNVPKYTAGYDNMDPASVYYNEWHVTWCFSGFFSEYLTSTLINGTFRATDNIMSTIWYAKPCLSICFRIFD